jgi:DNA-binding response OmpR family regulator
VGRALVLEPDPEIRELLRRAVVRLGHEALAPAYIPTGTLPALEAVVLEPAWAPALELVKALRAKDAGLALVFASLELTSAESAALRPVRYLVKPFGLRELEEAINAALPPTRRRSSSKPTP